MISATVAFGFRAVRLTSDKTSPQKIKNKIKSCRSFHTQIYVSLDLVQKADLGIHEEYDICVIERHLYMKQVLIGAITK